MTALVEEQRAEHPLGEADEETAISLPLASQVSVIEGEIGAMRGTTVSGLGRSCRKLLKERGGARAFASELILTEKVKSQDEQLKSQNDKLKSQDEKLQATNEHIR